LEQANCTGATQFWDGRCNECTDCGIGYGPSGTCGNGIGERYSCEVCPSLTFSDEYSNKPCRRCQHCDHREIVHPCNGSHDTECGGCEKGYVTLSEDSVICVDCKTLPDDYPDCVKSTVTLTTITPITSTQVMAAVDKSGDSKYWKSIAIGALTILVCLLIMFSVYKWYSRRCKRKADSNEDVPLDGFDSRLGITGISNGKKVHFKNTSNYRESDGESAGEQDPLLKPTFTKQGRPLYHRSFSEPARPEKYDVDFDQRRMNQRTIKKNEELDQLFQTACMKGHDLPLTKVGFVIKEEISLILNPKPEDQGVKFWYHFGLAWGIEEKLLNNFENKTMSVFEHVQPKGYTVEKLLHILKDMGNDELLHTVCNHVIKNIKLEKHNVIV
ncbi:uncharacterized protein LOC102806651, partial [Saccoglossus kowalevskii]